MNEYAVLAIAPELAPNTLVEEDADWDHETQTLKGSVSNSSITKEKISPDAGSEELRRKQTKAGWQRVRRMLCL